MKIGVFDSGAGGLAALRVLRSDLPRADFLFLADRRNAPYGTKTEPELVRLVACDIRRLRALGAESILAACCTASTVFPLLGEEERRGVLPILAPTAKAALASTKNRKIAVLSTEATAKSAAFPAEIRSRDPAAAVLSFPVQRLVALVESGVTDRNLPPEAEEEIARLLAPVKASGADTVILGCTHFSHLRRTVSRLLPGVCAVDAASEGAHALSALLRRKTPDGLPSGSGRLTYLD